MESQISLLRIQGITDERETQSWVGFGGRILVIIFNGLPMTVYPTWGHLQTLLSSPNIQTLQSVYIQVKKNVEDSSFCAYKVICRVGGVTVGQLASEATEFFRLSPATFTVCTSEILLRFWRTSLRP